MKTQIFTMLALGAILLTAEPAFAHTDRRGDGGGRAVAEARGGGGRSYAAARGGGERSYAVYRGGGSRSFAANSRGRSFTAPVARGYAFNRGSGRSFGSRPSVAFGGSAFTNRNSVGRGNYTYAFASHDGWRHDHEYSWRGHHYRWYDNAWFIVDPYYAGYPDYGYYGPDYGTAYNDNGSVAVQVQQDLAQAGYYRGPIDGIIGPGTQGAIAAFQRDNGLPVTGTITQSLLDVLNEG